MMSRWRAALSLVWAQRAPNLFFGQVKPYMQLPELLRADLGGRTHHKVLRPLVHREQHHLAQVLFTGKQHHDAVNTGRDAAVRRSAERKCMQHAAEFLLE